MVSTMENSNRSVLKQDRRYIFIAVFFYAVIITDILRLVSAITGISAIDSAVETVRNILYIGIFAGYFYYSTKQARNIGIILGFFYFIMLVFSLLLNPSIQVYAFTLTMMFISRYLLAFIMISQLEDPLKLIRKVTQIAWIIPIYVLLYAISPKDLSTGYAYSITFSYNLLLPAVACFYSFYVLKEKRLYSLAIDIAALAGMLIYGSRGTIVCIGVAVLYILFFNKNNFSTRRHVTQLVLVVAGFTVFLAKDTVIELLTQLLPNSRSLYLIKNSSFLWDSNRSNYFDMAKEFLNESPLKVTGLAGDTFIYGNKFGMGMELGRHSHNMFLEIVVSYGLILGGIACIYIVYRILKSFFRARWSPEMKAICAFVIVPLLPFILISGSLCQSYQYWLLLGGVFSIFSRDSRKSIRKQNKYNIQ